MAKNTKSEKLMIIPPVSNISIEISFFYTEQIENLISFPTMKWDLLYLIYFLIYGQLNCPTPPQKSS